MSSVLSEILVKYIRLLLMVYGVKRCELINSFNRFHCALTTSHARCFVLRLMSISYVCISAPRCWCSISGVKELQKTQFVIKFRSFFAFLHLPTTLSLFSIVYMLLHKIIRQWSVNYRVIVSEVEFFANKRNRIYRTLTNN